MWAHWKECRNNEPSIIWVGVILNYCHHVTKNNRTFVRHCIAEAKQYCCNIMYYCNVTLYLYFVQIYKGYQFVWGFFDKFWLKIWKGNGFAVFSGFCPKICKTMHTQLFSVLRICYMSLKCFNSLHSWSLIGDIFWIAII